MSSQLLDPIIDGGIHSTHFFNGRRLTAEDLNREKDANREHERLLGQAIGEGVVYGLQVNKIEENKLEIRKGLAINRNGDTLYLPDDAKLSLIPPDDDEHVIKADFTNCSKITPVEYPQNSGAYIVLIKPATKYAGSAPMSSIPGNGPLAGCGKSDLVEGVQFRLVKMDITGPAFEGLTDDTRNILYDVATITDDLASVSMFRNIVAHACFGTEEKEAFMLDPFGTEHSSSYGAIEKLRDLDDEAEGKVKDCEVPLAVIRWVDMKIQFVDVWSARRRSYQLNSSSFWPELFSLRRMAQAEVMFFQFQEQITDILKESESAFIASIIAAKNFLWLPPAGFLPLDKNGSHGFNYVQFFNGINIHDPIVESKDFDAGPIFIEGSRISMLLRESFNYPPLNLNSKIFFWLYRIRENYPLDIQEWFESNQYILFVSGYLPYHGVAKFDVSRLDRSNYVSVLLGPD